MVKLIYLLPLIFISVTTTKNPIVHESTTTDMVKYELFVRTGFKGGNGTSNIVHLSLADKDGHMGNKLNHTTNYGLKRGSLWRPKFSLNHGSVTDGSGWTFDFPPKYLNAKKTIQWTGDLDEADEADGWSCDYVRVLSRQKRSAWTTKEFLLGSTELDLLLHPIYALSMTTLDIEYAGTDAKVTAILHGENGDSYVKNCNKEDYNDRKRGVTDTYFFNYQDDLGELTHITLEKAYKKGDRKGWIAGNITIYYKGQEYYVLITDKLSLRGDSPQRLPLMKR